MLYGRDEERARIGELLDGARRVCAKLGVTSRRQLARLPLAEAHGLALPRDAVPA
jgi:hypothetical protein